MLYFVPLRLVRGCEWPPVVVLWCTGGNQERTWQYVDKAPRCTGISLVVVFHALLQDGWFNTRLTGTDRRSCRVQRCHGCSDNTAFIRCEFVGVMRDTFSNPASALPVESKND